MLYGSRIGGAPAYGGAQVLGGAGLYGSRIGGFGGFGAAPVIGGATTLAAPARVGGFGGFGGVQTLAAQPATTFVGNTTPLVTGAPVVTGVNAVNTVGLGGASFVGPYAGGLGLAGNSAIISPALQSRLGALPSNMLASLPRITTEVQPVQMENTIVDVEEVPVGYQYINHGIRRIPDNTPEFNEILTQINSGSLPVGAGHSLVGNGSLALGAMGGSFVGGACCNNLPAFGVGAVGARSVIGGFGAAPLIGAGLAGMTTSIAPAGGIIAPSAGLIAPTANLYGSYAGARPLGGFGAAPVLGGYGAAPVLGAGLGGYNAGPAGLYSSYAGVRRF